MTTSLYYSEKVKEKSPTSDIENIQQDAKVYKNDLGNYFLHRECNLFY